ncbi:MAG: RdgB/HAM1 family non-canonical purine NTP pyrophosphatase [Faecalibacterium sp.]
MLICAATGNQKKLEELRRILEAQGHEVKSQKELGITLDPEETGHSFVENAVIKAQAICDAANLPTIADDSGLCVQALDGAPGVYSARYAGEHGNDEANNDKLLAALADVPADDRWAKFVSSVCFMLPSGKYFTSIGECAGMVADARKLGDYGFGYDPLFIPFERGLADGGKAQNTAQLSYAQLTPAEKDAISHRGRAMEQLQNTLPAFLETNAQ